MKIPSTQYVAGFLDGEGYVSRGDFRIELFNTHVATLRAIHTRVKVGRVKLRDKSGQGGHLGKKKQWKLQILGRFNVQRFLKLVLPYVITKRRRCTSMMKAQSKFELRGLNNGR